MTQPWKGPLCSPIATIPLCLSVCAPALPITATHYHPHVAGSSCSGAVQRGRGANALICWSACFSGRRPHRHHTRNGGSCVLNGLHSLFCIRGLPRYHNILTCNASSCQPSLSTLLVNWQALSSSSSWQYRATVIMQRAPLSYSSLSSFCSNTSLSSYVKRTSALLCKALTSSAMQPKSNSTGIRRGSMRKISTRCAFDGGLLGVWTGIAVNCATKSPQDEMRCIFSWVGST